MVALARPKKSGLSYFPLDTDFFDNDSRIKILKARYRADGIMIYVYLLCEIYKNGYYIQVGSRRNDHADRKESKRGICRLQKR